MEELEEQKNITKKLRIIEIILLEILIILILGVVVLREDTIEAIIEKNKDSFNCTFMNYVRSGVSYENARDCIISIRVNNEIERKTNNHIINCEASVGDLKKEKTYNIDCEFDSDGYINSIIIIEEGE